MAQKNVRPEITGQRALTTGEGTPIEIFITDLTISDPDDTYPVDFTLSLSGGQNYKRDGNIITPNDGFTGELKVDVTVNDGEDDSKKFELTINVTPKANVAPTITGQQVLTTTMNTPITLRVGNLAIDDPDNTFPGDFRLKLYNNGPNYIFTGNTVTPASGFIGTLKVRVSVLDTENAESNIYTLDIEVDPTDNQVPLVTSQDALSTFSSAPITLAVTNLRITDPDNTYPTDFTLRITDGPNYSVAGNTIRPDGGFKGNLTVPIKVFDGTAESPVFNLTITVLNRAPSITGQDPLSTLAGIPIVVTPGNLRVTDPDDNYPNGFTMTLKDGAKYSVIGNIISPARGFRGELTVPVTVNDGTATSNEFSLKIAVNGLINVAPTITGQTALSTPSSTPITLLVSNLMISDPDNAYPTDFTLQTSSGSNYAVTANTITPTAGFKGNLTVPVTVFDGTAESPVFNLIITVLNRAPSITGQDALSTEAGTPIVVALANLKVTDPDDNYPNGFTMTLKDGANYSVSGNTVTPNAAFKGELTVPVTVNDGTATSNEFSLKIAVAGPANVAPVITAQTALSTLSSASITLSVTNLVITDPDNAYPTDFTLRISDGANYTVSSNTIKPAAGFKGALTVAVKAFDGSAESPVFNLTITVLNRSPLITSQEALQTLAGTPIVITLGNLIVTDADNNYPNGFTLTLKDGANYTVSGTTVTPDAAFLDGELTVPVTVNDGTDASNEFSLKIGVNEPANLAPEITGQVAIEIDEDKPIPLTTAMLVIKDPDSQTFTLKVLPAPASANYTVSGAVVTPAENFNGELTVRVTVSDAKNESAPYPLKISVKPVNDAPEIMGQQPLSTFVTTPIEIKIQDVIVSDPDSRTFTLKVNPVSNASNYTVSGNTITPVANFKGELDVLIVVNDGAINSAVHSLTVNVLDAPNQPPVIDGQTPDPIITTQNAPFEISKFNLIVTDPDSKNFTITIKPGASYTFQGTTVTPAVNYIGPLQIIVTVSDGVASSPEFKVDVNVVAPSAKPQIIGQKSVTTNEDVPVTIVLGDLLVTDADDTYPNGFTLAVLNGPGYTTSGNTITPVKDFNGFLMVSVQVTDDDGKASDPYGMAIIINPVDDAPVITRFETDAISYEPGAEAIQLTSIFEVEDIDNEFLSFAEVGITRGQYTKGYDELLFTNTASIRGVLDLDSGKLSLIGYAPIQEYEEAIRSIRYHFRLDEEDIVGEQILPGNKTIYVNVHDGQRGSETKTRKIIMETDVTIDIPSAFSPNDDNVNETWQIVAKTNPQQCENAIVKVYDKRGHLLFQSVGIEKEWDGRYNGQLLPMDTYFYTVDLNLTYADRTYRGVVTIVR
ncbi:MAG: tandem-95 repeat protein [Chryseolinea sp.]